MSEHPKVEFPYDTLAQAEKDKFKKLGGPDAAFRYLVKGFKNVAWRKRADFNAKMASDAEEERFRLENSKPTPPAKPILRPEARPEAKPEGKSLRPAKRAS